MLNLTVFAHFAFILGLFVAPMQSVYSVTQETVYVSAEWRTVIIRKCVYIYRNNVLVFVMPLPL